MSNNNMDDQVEIPEGEVSDFADQKAKKGLSPMAKVGIAGGGAAALLVAAFMFTGNSGTAVPQSAVRSAPNLNATPGGAEQENPRFQELLQQANDQRAAEASGRGETFIPTPESRLERFERFDRADAGNINENERAQQPQQVIPDPTPRQQPQVRQVEQRVIPAPTAPQRPRVETTAPDQQPKNRYAEGMVQQMGAVARTQNDTSSMGIFERPPILDENVQAMQQASGSVSSAASGSGDMTTQQDIVLSAGTVLYGETLTSSSSDLPGPVLVEVTNGEFKGSRLIGKFSVGEAVPRMVVEFTSMTLPDGTNVSVSAFAVDGMSAETAVASDVDRRYIARYAPILAATFITGYARAAAQPSQQVVDLGNGNSIVNSPSTERQSLFAGLAAASEAIGNDMIRNAPRGPEVKLRSGWPIAILFVEPVSK